MAKKARLKAAAVLQPKDAAEAERWIAELGELQRQCDRLEAGMNDAIEKVKAEFAAMAALPMLAIKQRFAGLRGWATANRPVLTEDGKTKTWRCNSGEIAWRNKPPSVKVEDAEAVKERIEEAIDELDETGADNLEAAALERFLRRKVELNREAMLEDAERAQAIEGITIVRDVEEFIVTPAQQELQAVTP